MLNNNHHNYKKGFTLIELLVVIAIIGLLSSVVLASLNSARNKAKVAKAQMEMKQVISAIVIAQGEQGKPLLSFAPAANCGQCSCQNGNIASTACSTQWESALSQIQAATNGSVKGLTNLKKDPWGNPYIIDANQGESGFASPCTTVDGFWVWDQEVPGVQKIPLNPSCP